MPNRRRLIVVGVFTLVLGLILLFPARVAYDWFAPPTAALSGIKGTIWRGSAQGMVVNGIYISDIEWRIMPLKVFTGRLGYVISGSPSYGLLETELAIGLGGDLYLTNLDSRISLSLLQQATGIRGLQGTATAVFERLQVSDGVPVAADGSIEVRGLVVPLVAPNSIDGYRADFFTQEEGVIASVEDTDGVLDLAGRLQISDDGTYEFLGQLAAKPETPDRVRQQMRFLGTANDRGQYELRLEGQL